MVKFVIMFWAIFVNSILFGQKRVTFQPGRRGMGLLLSPSKGGTTVAIASSNIGFKLLKKHGGEEGTDLRISEQGMLEPVEAYWKNN
ncbi:G-patch domain containing protein [Parasponia andersonii]|uniref:G-patch domain containing protein n=1 Tax=Parasponia andersonii TaxID=3476 RepID=A0A2P5D359_PARAD|nr:G-patch domain containing protein [Parasponia andersonii]